MNKKNTVILYLLLYWVICIIFPFIVVSFLPQDGLSIDWPGYIMVYILLIAPFLFVIPYLLTRNTFDNKKQKVMYVLLGLIVPYIFIYIFMAWTIYQMGGPRF